MARPIWSGTINFGMVNIPVEMNMSVHEQSIHFHMLSKDGSCRLRQKLVCPETGQEYNFSQTAKGIEIGPGNYVLIDKHQMDRLKPEKGRSLEIVQFFDASEIDPMFYDHVYYLDPGKDAKKSYKLLVEAMADSGKCALGRFVLREKQYLAVIRVLEHHLVLHTLHYADEIEHVDEEVTDAIKKTRVSEAELRMAGELIKSMTDKLHLEDFKDEYREKLQSLIDAKAKGKEIAQLPQEEEGPIHEPINLMEALKKSLAAGLARMEGQRHRRSA